MAVEAASGPPPEVAVGAIVIDQGQLLLVRRGRGPGLGQWSVPGGRVEPGEPMSAAVVREVREETALEVRCGRFIGWVERIGQDHHFLIMDFEAGLAGGRTAQAGDDAAEVAWVDLDAVPDVDLVDGLLEFLTEHHIIG